MQDTTVDCDGVVRVTSRLLHCSLDSSVLLNLQNPDCVLYTTLVRELKSVRWRFPLGYASSEGRLESSHKGSWRHLERDLGTWPSRCCALTWLRRGLFSRRSPISFRGFTIVAPLSAWEMRKKSESPDLLESTRLHANDYMTVYFAERSRKIRGNTERNVKSFCRRNVLFFELCRWGLK